MSLTLLVPPEVHDGAMEESIRVAVVESKMRVNRQGSSTFAIKRHTSLVDAEAVDVLLHPFHGRSLVFQKEAGCSGIVLLLRVHCVEGVEAVIGGDEDDRLAHGDLSLHDGCSSVDQAWEESRFGTQSCGRAEFEAAAVDPEHYGESDGEVDA
jgi:hypothetical protein